MVRAPLLQANEVEAKLRELDGWTFDAKRLKRTYRFPTFLDGIDFVGVVARIAEEMNHHPDIFIRFHRISFELMTHGSQGVTGLDVELAGKIHAAAKGRAKED